MFKTSQLFKNRSWFLKPYACFYLIWFRGRFIVQHCFEEVLFFKSKIQKSILIRNLYLLSCIYHTLSLVALQGFNIGLPLWPISYQVFHYAPLASGRNASIYLTENSAQEQSCRKIWQIEFTFSVSLDRHVNRD